MADQFKRPKPKIKPKPTSVPLLEAGFENYRLGGEISPPTQEWDCFETIPPSIDYTITPNYVRSTLWLLKFVIYIPLTFVLLILLVVGSKCLTLLMTSMVQPNHEISNCETGDGFEKYRLNNDERKQWVWLLFFGTISPYCLGVIEFGWLWFSKKCTTFSYSTWIIAIALETVQSLGLSILMFFILPQLDTITGATLLSCVGVVPVLLRVLVSESFQNRAYSLLNLVVQILNIILCVILVWNKLANPWDTLHVLICLIAISCEWWENYLKMSSKCSAPNFILKWLDNVRKDLAVCRYPISCVASVFKIATSCLVLLLSGLFGELKSADLAFSSKTIHNNWPLVCIFVAHLACGRMSFFLVRYACKMRIHRICFALPVCIATCITVPTLLIIANIDSCTLRRFVAQFVLCFNVGKNNSSNKLPNIGWKMNKFVDIDILLVILWILCSACQLENTRHVWKGIKEIMAYGSKLFISPILTNSVLIDSWLLMNKRAMAIEEFTEEHNRIIKEKNIKTNSARNGRIRSEFTILELESSETADLIRQKFGIESDDIDPLVYDDTNDAISRLYVCVTMWHEKGSEMMKTLKSVLLLDFDQSCRRIVRENYNPNMHGYYEMEVHILFDNAMEAKVVIDEQNNANSKKEWDINSYVETFLTKLNEAVTQVYSSWNINMSFDTPAVVITPYGGRLIWRLPSGNKLVVHVKDEAKIRKRKRWSQCMYMYYFFKHRLMDRDDLRENKQRIEKISNNSYILALDGDIDFQPSAVEMVLDLMIKNHNLGAACGRIHPVGSGLMVWYQIFEYAIGHWFQKSTEHKLGSVLCSPGCFSLMRGKALMDKSVMNKYTTKSVKASHYVQYDQGEDRWLCNLLIQRGWRIEYCAASDSYTHAPEDFKELFNQRRRWTSSTLANIWELISNCGETVKINQNISWLYIAYQVILLISTCLSPAIVFLIMVSAMTSGLQWQFATSFWIVFAPTALFMFVCLKSDNANLKLDFAFVLSTLSALLMLVALLGNVINIFQYGLFSPDAILFIGIILSFIFAAFLHLQEFSYILCFPIYVLFIPTMYLFLIIYSATNMNEMSWGTRDKVETETKSSEVNRPNKINSNTETYKNSENFLVNMSTSVSNQLACGFYCFGSQENQNLQSNLNQTNLDTKEHEPKSFEPKSFETKNYQSTKYEEFELKQTDSKELKEQTEPEQIPFWFSNRGILRSFDHNRIRLTETEHQFWTELIANYLSPLNEDKNLKDIADEKARSEVASRIGKTKQKLKSLRNKAVFCFGMVNVMVVLLLYMFELHKNVLNVQFKVGEQNVRIDPAGFFLLTCFAIILSLQLVGMIIHRFTTLVHLFAYTKFSCSSPHESELTMVGQFLQMGKDSETDQSIVQDNGNLQKLNLNLVNCELLNSHKQYKRLMQVYLDRIQIFTNHKNSRGNKKMLPSKWQKIVDKILSCKKS